MEKIEKKVPNLTSSRFICFLDDKITEKKIIPKKFLVLEWIEGNQFSFLEQKNLKGNAKFDSEKDFIRMMLILLNELNFLHNSKIIHRDIKPENIMFIEKEKELYFYFIDFGICFDKTEDTQKIKVGKDFYKPKEINSEKEDFKSDLFSLGKCFKQIMEYNSVLFKLNQKIETLIEKMLNNKIEERPSLLVCFEQLFNYSIENQFSFDILSFEINRRKNNSTHFFKQPKICDNFEEIRKDRNSNN